MLCATYSTHMEVWRSGNNFWRPDWFPPSTMWVLGFGSSGLVTNIFIWWHISLIIALLLRAVLLCGPDQHQTLNPSISASWGMPFFRKKGERKKKKTSNFFICFVCVCMHICAHAIWCHIYRDQRSTCGSGLFSSTMWVAGIKLKSHSAASSLTNNHLAGPVTTFEHQTKRSTYWQ